MKPVIAAPLPSGAVLVSTPDYTFLHQIQSGTQGGLHVVS